jgi:hypothetical protein
MTGKTISTTVDKPVTLGVGGYTSPLSITSTGEILQNPNDISGLTSVAALFVPVAAAGAVIVNDGRIQGGEGIYQANDFGGDGVSMAAAATLTNALLILGGAGGANSSGLGEGGAGLVASAGGVIANTGAVIGGAGGGLGRSATDGGAGMVLTGATLTNSGHGFLAGIIGGAGGNAYYGGNGGAGLAMTSGRATNSSFIVGGQGGSGTDSSSTAGDGVDLAEGGTLTNLAGGQILGGAGGVSALINLGGIGVSVTGPSEGAEAAYVSNAGTITGGAGAAGAYLYQSFFGEFEYGGNGGTGLQLQGSLSRFVNTGTVSGGAGGAAKGTKTQYTYYGGQGGTGLIVLTGATATNGGEIAGGAGGYGSSTRCSTISAALRCGPARMAAPPATAPLTPRWFPRTGSMRNTAGL